MSPIKCQEAKDPSLKIAALILARGCSKSIAGKNIKPFNGIPLICHVLQVVTRCSFFHSYWVSTDDDDICRTVIESFHSLVKIHLRSPETCQDTSSSIQAVQEFVQQHSELDAVALIQCTSPLQEVTFLEEGYKKLASGYPSVFSARRDKSLRWMMKAGEEGKEREGSKLVPLNLDAARRPRRQDWEGELVETGHFYFSQTSLILDGLFQHVNGTIVVIPDDHCIELDEPYQWDIAQLMDTKLKLSQNSDHE